MDNYYDYDSHGEYNNSRPATNPSGSINDMQYDPGEGQGDQRHHYQDDAWGSDIFEQRGYAPNLSRSVHEVLDNLTIDQPAPKSAAERRARDARERFNNRIDDWRWADDFGDENPARFELDEKVNRGDYLLSDINDAALKMLEGGVLSEERFDSLHGRVGSGGWYNYNAADGVAHRPRPQSEIWRPHVQTYGGQHNPPMSEGQWFGSQMPVESERNGFPCFLYTNSFANPRAREHHLNMVH